MAYTNEENNINNENNSPSVRVMSKNEKNAFDGITIDDVSNAGAYEDPNAKAAYQETYEQTDNGFRYTKYSTGGNGTTFRVYRIGGVGSKSNGLMGSLFGNSLVRSIVVGLIAAAILGFLLFVAMPLFAVIAVAAVIIYFLRSMF